MRTLEWAVENMVNDQGRAYDHWAFPHIGAPGGPMDAFDDNVVRTISLQWATRLGKTFFSQTSLLKTADCDPCPMMTASSVEQLAKEVMGRMYAAIEKRDRLSDKMALPERLWNKGLMQFKECRIHSAWSRSTSTLADKNLKVGHAGEYDKWEYQTTSKEAHPHKLFDDRFKDYQSVRKVIYEGTPTVTGRSPIESRFLQGWGCLYFVPCPECHKYQTLRLGEQDKPGGIKWGQPEIGKTTSSYASKTAHYSCEHCEAKISDHQRPWMMRRGVWVPEGCSVNHEEALKHTQSILEDYTNHDWNGWRDACWIEGEPMRGGVSASYQLSSFYALSLGWGDIAREFMDSRKNPHLLRNFRNQWQGLTWELHNRRREPSELAKRLDSGLNKGAVHDSVGVITVGVDVQDLHLVYVVAGWGKDDRCYVLDYGTVFSFQELLKGVFSQVYTGVRGDNVVISMAGIDSGFRTDEVYQFCSNQEFKGAVRPTKGVDSDGSKNRPLIASSLEGSKDSTRKALFNARKMHLWKFSKPYFQERLQRRLDSLEAGQDGSLNLPTDATKDEDFMEQLSNNAPIEKPGGSVAWEKVHESYPDDYRDALVIADVVREMWERGSKDRYDIALRQREVNRNNMKGNAKPVDKKKPQSKYHDRQGGWLEGIR